MSFHVPEKFRVLTGPLASNTSYGNNGGFQIPASIGHKRASMFAIASDGEGWEHVSISTTHRPPTWGEMCFVKALFWDDEDCVIQFHPPRSDYVNNHPHCLHLWRPTEQQIPRPPSILVGIKVPTPHFAVIKGRKNEIKHS